MRRQIRRRTAGFTLAEICIGLAVVSIVGGVAYSLMISSTTLLAKNLSLNSSSIITRGALDRIYSELNYSNRQPALINADGSAVSGNGPAAGIIFDRYLGGPYVVGNPGNGLAANATTFKLFYSTDPWASPPLPAVNDVVIMDGSSRALVSSCSTPASPSAPTPSPLPTPGQMVTVTLQKSLGNYTVPPVSSGTAIPWSSLTQQTAYLVHRKAFVVVPIGGTNGPGELRLYPDAETVTDYSDPSKYVVLTRSVVEKTPFSLVTANNATFINIAMRIEDQQFNKRLASQQANEVNTFQRVDSMLRPKNLPQTQ